MNNLDSKVAEDPGELMIYGGIGRVARDWESYGKIIETLIVQSDKLFSVFRTYVHAPRILIANSNVLLKWANWTRF